MKKALKLIAVLVGGALVVFLILIGLFIKSLPSAWELKQQISPKSLQKPSFQPPVAKDLSGEDSELSEKKLSASTTSHEVKVDKAKELSLRVMREDFLNEQKPLSSVCAQLGRASGSNFLRKDHSGSVNEFMKSLVDEENHDPLAESAAPLFRYVFRLEKFKELIAMVDAADSERDSTLFKKAEFYTKLGLAAQEMTGQKGAIDHILMKSYNLFMFARAIGERPELARDPASLQYCEQLEKNLNAHLDFDADDQAIELQKFLDYARISPDEIGYDPHYRSDVKFNIGQKSLTMNQIWLESLFAKDIERAQKELKERQKLDAKKPLPGGS